MTNNGFTALMAAAMVGHLSVVQALSVYGADREVKTTDPGVRQRRHCFIVHIFILVLLFFFSSFFLLCGSCHPTRAVFYVLSLVPVLLGD